ncbi:MAG: histidine kinase [Clostridia bacterium]|nr:histidine kinase [Clostridia bacterium]
MSVRSKVLISMLASFLVVAGFLGVFMYSNFKDVTENQVKSDINGIMQENVAGLDSIAAGISRSFAAVGDNDFIVEALKEKENSPEEKAREKILLMDEYKNIFELSVGPYAEDYMLHFYINEELPLAASFKNMVYNPLQNEDFGIYSTEKLHDMKWYKETLESSAPRQTFTVEEQPKYIFFSKAISEHGFPFPDGRGYMGIGVVGINCERLLSNMQRRMVTGDSEIIILDQDNKIIDATEKEHSADLIAEILRDNPIGLSMTEQIDNDDYYISIARSDTGVTFVSVTTKDSIYLKGNDVRNIAIVAIIIAVILAAVLIYILSYYLTRPIKRLSHSISQISYENLVLADVQPKAKDEIGELYRAFNALLGKIEASIERENEQNEKSRQLEIQMLQAQINPHFLYNVLDSISWLAMENNQDDIGEMTDLLSQIFSYSIKDGKILANLREELENVEKYVILQKKRYADDIELTIDAEESCLECLLPKCILQPLVENSIVHGLGAESNGININISVKHQEDYIKILVSDDGKGCDLEKLSEILNGNNEESFKYHLGVRNVAMRINQLYGNGYKLSYSQNSDGGMTAQIILPVNKES